ncbi:MAG: hypothetical protein ABI977_11115 [Acidobacteriota bacterium]
MKQVLFAVCCCALFAVSMRAQNPGQTVLSKNVSGPITRSSVELTLTSNTGCDQTQSFLPEGSKLISQSFSLNADTNGVGTFQGTAQIISPDGRTILQGQLRGTVGINTGGCVSRTCRLPWHLEGLFETTPSTYERTIVRSTTDLKVALMMLNFSADLNQQSTSPLPLYQGRLDGLIPTLPASAARVTIAPDKASYTINDPITAIVVNGAEDAIQTYDLKSYCSIVQLQIQNGNQWDDAGDCLLKRLPFPVNILPNQQVDVLLPMNQGIPGPVAGTYRLALTFRFLAKGIPVSDSFTAFSPPFVIASQPPSNNVIVKAERDVYPERETVVVKITNDSDQSIVTLDHKSYCSILTVQKQQVSDWITVAPCLLATPTRLVKIGAREDVLLKLPADNTASRIEPGTYRLELVYFAMDANGQPTGNPSTVYSRTFTVAAKE